jgi:hypothetical protein
MRIQTRSPKIREGEGDRESGKDLIVSKVIIVDVGKGSKASKNRS